MEQKIKIAAPLIVAAPTISMVTHKYGMGAPAPPIPTVAICHAMAWMIATIVRVIAEPVRPAEMVPVTGVRVATPVVIALVKWGTRVPLQTKV